MSKYSSDSFRELLESQYSWPALYTFKFIVLSSKKEEVTNLFKNHDIVEKPSKGGKYVSITSKVMARDADDVINTYITASNIEGIIAL